MATTYYTRIAEKRMEIAYYSRSRNRISKLVCVEDCSRRALRVFEQAGQQKDVPVLEVLCIQD